VTVANVATVAVHHKDLIHKDLRLRRHHRGHGHAHSALFQVWLKQSVHAGKWKRVPLNTAAQTLAEAEKDALIRAQAGRQG
jgi:hypothetical protein